MAALPSPGASDGTYGTELNEYLVVEHNDDGTHKIEWPIDGTPTRIFTKYLTGTLDNDSSTSVAHGVTAANILSVNIICFDGTDYVSGSYRAADAGATGGFYSFYGTTNITIAGVGTNLQGEAYRIKIDYTA